MALSLFCRFKTKAVDKCWCTPQHFVVSKTLKLSETEKVVNTGLSKANH